MKVTTNILSAALAVLIASVSPVLAQGMIGELIEQGCGGCGLGKQLDRAHDGMGRPLDGAFATGLNTVVPGAGTVWKNVDDMKRAAAHNRAVHQQRMQQIRAQQQNQQQEMQQLQQQMNEELEQQQLELQQAQSQNMTQMRRIPMQGEVAIGQPWAGGQQVNVAYGMFCTTPNGRFGPGRPQAIGSHCQAMTWNGPVSGQISH